MLMQPLHSHPRVTAGGRFGSHFDDGLVYKVPLDPFSYQVRAGAAAEQPSHSGLAAVGPVGVGPVGAMKGAAVIACG